MININEEWVTGKRYLMMARSNDSRIQGRYEITANSGHCLHLATWGQEGPNSLQMLTAKLAC
jgi:hypothetical protein